MADVSKIKLPSGTTYNIKDTISGYITSKDIINTAEGSIASFPDGADGYPLKSLKVQLEPIQDLHGYDKPWTGGGGKNKFPTAEWYTEFSASANNLLVGDTSVFLSAGTYTLSFEYYTEGISSNQSFWRIYSEEVTHCETSKQIGYGGLGLLMPTSWTQKVVTFTTTQDGWFGIDNGQLRGGVHYRNIQLESGSSATAWTPYSNICPISGHTEASANISPYEQTEKHTITGKNIFNAPNDASQILVACHIDANQSFVASANISCGIRYYDANKTRIDSWSTLPNSYGDRRYRVISSSTAIEYVEFYGSGSPTNLMIELGTTPSDYEPYGYSYTTPLGRTVYGGTVDMVSGLLTITDGYIASYNGETLPSTWISDRDEYASGTTPTIGAEVVYTLATPQTYQLTPQTIALLEGTNNVWGSGDVTIEYVVDGEAAEDIKFIGGLNLPSWAKASTKPSYTASEVGAQPTLVSGTNIKTINNQSLLGSGNITIEAGTSGVTNLVDGSSTGSVRGIDAAEENSSYTMGADAVAEGISTKASGPGSHAEGKDTVASGNYSHAEGFTSYAVGVRSHAEGRGTWAGQDAAHAEGYSTTASGIASHAQNIYTIARGEYQTAIGKYNISQGTNDSLINTDHAFIIGNGTSDSARSNALTVDWLGNVDIASGAMYKINGTALSASDVGAVPTSRTVNGKALSSNISLTASDVSAVPTTRTVNGKALSSDISLDASDVGAVPTSRTVNGKALSSNISLTASDVSALPDTTAIPSKTSDLTNDSGFFKKAYAYIDEVTATTITAVSTAGRKKVPIESLKERIGFTYDSTNKGIIVSESGMYAISITLSVNPATSGDLMGALVYQNSSVLMGPSYKRMGGNYDEIVVSPVIAPLNAGDVLTLYCQNNTGGRGTITSGKLAVWRVG